MTDLAVYNERKKDLVARLDRQSSLMHAMLPPELSLPRFRAVAMAAIARTPAILDCYMPTVVLGIVQAAECGLEIGREAHLVPFWNRKKNRKDCQFIADYKGLVHLALLSDRVSRIEAELVFDGDEFSYEKGTAPRITHKPTAKDRRSVDRLTHAYAVAFYTDGSSQFEVMDRDALDAIRKRSNARNRDGDELGPWKTDTLAMYRKCPIRQLYRFLPLVNRARAAYAIDQSKGWPQLPGGETAGRVDALKSKLEGLDGDDVLDAEFEEAPK